MAHTPGPWKRKDTPDYAEIHPSSGELRQAIALVGAPDDANLIAAAPDLLKACKAAKALLINELNEPGRTVFWVLVDAIRKAEPQP